MMKPKFTFSILFLFFFLFLARGGWLPTDQRIDSGDSPGVSESLDAQIACSGDNVYVVWSDFRNAPNTYTDIYFNHSADGGANWQTPDIRLNTGDLPGASESWGPQIACSNGNVYAVWTDRRGGSHISDIFFNYSTEEGANWRTKDIRLNSMKLPIDYHAQYPQIACSGENVYVVWQDSRNGLYDIYFNSNISSTFALTISASKGGTVRPKPGEHSHIPGTKVKIKAFADKDYKFSHWSGDVEGSENPIKFTMDSDKTIKAHFIKQHTLALRSQKGGTTRPSPGNHTIDHGTGVTITAIPESNYRFSNWTGDVLSTENPLTIEMNSDMSITANFVRQYNLTLDAGTGGTTNPPQGISPYDKGAKVTITLPLLPIIDFLNGPGIYPEPLIPLQ